MESQGLQEPEGGGDVTLGAEEGQRECSGGADLGTGTRQEHPCSVIREKGEMWLERCQAIGKLGRRTLRLL